MPPPPNLPSPSNFLRFSSLPRACLPGRHAQASARGGKGERGGELCRAFAPSPPLPFLPSHRGSPPGSPSPLPHFPVPSAHASGAGGDGPAGATGRPPGSGLELPAAPASQGGGTTDYAVDIFHAALRTGKYVCFLGEETALPMVYMPDCLEGTLRLMTAPKEALTQTTYNVASMSFTPRELAESIRRFIPGFELRCLPDFREEIARSWPASIDDSRARRDWGWSPEFDLDAMTAHMLHEISNQMSAPGYGAKPDRGSRLSAAVAG
mmetsp:Transcript_28953/g.69164  ORF Transcript_28953/g.69164 Transcript_28953/m.69164 type:complete len:266 (-) Transcript_28953:348-1145(-)